MEHQTERTETAAEKVKRLKSMIGGHFKEKEERRALQAASAAKSEHIAALLRSRLKGAQVEKGRMAVTEWMRSDNEKGA